MVRPKDTKGYIPELSVTVIDFLLQCKHRRKIAHKNESY